MTDKEEYMDDGYDTMTDVADDEALNPDYDRVSGSGAMPSLEDFLGVTHTTDGLGDSADPFGGVIGDPAFSDNPLGGYSSQEDEGESGFENDAESDNNTDTETEAQTQDVKFSIKSVLDGSFFKGERFKRNIPFVGVLFLCAILHIANRNHAESLIRDEINLKREVREYKAESIWIAAKLMGVSKVTEVSYIVEKRKLGIHAPTVPPMEFVIDKFQRADSLQKEEMEVLDRPLSYDGEFNVSPKNR